MPPGKDPVEPPAIEAPEDMIRIPEGLFLMGSPSLSGDPEERPMHEVAVAAFFLDRTEVTAGAYAACEKAGACSPPRGTMFLCTGGRPERADHPINCIDYAQAEAYCRSMDKRLPSEREWEYAARGGSELRRYAWGDEPPDGTRACYDHVGTCAVGSFPPGAFGLLDMSGGVWEWTSTWFGPYPDEAEHGRYRVYRGGSYSRRFPKWLRAVLRNRFRPEQWSAGLGVRCAKTVTPIRCPDETAARPAARPELPPGCARVRGTPACEPGYAWNGARCALGGTPGGAAPGAARGGSAPEGAAPPADTPVVRARSPELDADCRRHYPATPFAYRYTGGTFHRRNPVISGGGCTKRDVGDGWTSACCPE